MCSASITPRYNTNRWYDPTVGRFITGDPLGLDVDTNDYRYVHNSPTNFADPTGLEATEVPFNVDFNEAKYLSGKLVLDVQDLTLKAYVQMQRVADHDTWNSLGDGIPDDWGRKTYSSEESGHWLWPHLYKLLNGDYGGLDPVKKVKNDFAAVLVKNYDANGAFIDEAVSGKWSQVGGNKDVSHIARSTEFNLPTKPCTSGYSLIWVSFLDTFGQRYAPTGYPREWAGYTLAFFEVFWMASEDKIYHLDAKQITPPPSSNFRSDLWKPDQNPPD